MMASSGMPWIKLYNDFLDDPKIGQLSRSTQYLFVQLLLVAGECDAEGALVNGDDPLTVEQLSWRLRFDVSADLAELERSGFVMREDGALCIPNFSKRQGRPQSEKREQWRERQQRKRDTEEEPEDVTRDAKESHASVTAPEKEREKSREEKEGEGDSAPSGAERGPPTECQRYWATLTEICHIKRVTDKTRGRLNTLIKWLRTNGYTIGDLKAFAVYWEADPWKRENRPIKLDFFDGSEFGAWVDAGKPLKPSANSRASPANDSHANIEKALQRIKAREVHDT